MFPQSVLVGSQKESAALASVDNFFIVGRVALGSNIIHEKHDYSHTWEQGHC